MLWRNVSSVVVALLLAGSAAAQYGPGGGYGGGGGFGGGGYGDGGYGGGGNYGGGGFGQSPGGYAPTPSPYGNRYEPPNPNRGLPYGTNPYQPDTSIPVYETYEYTVEYKYCTKCNKKVSDSASVGDRCPHCGVYWSHDDRGNRAPATFGNVGSSARVGGMIGGIVAAIVGLIIRMLMSSSGGSRTQTRAQPLEGRLMSSSSGAPPLRFDFDVPPKGERT